MADIPWESEFGDGVGAGEPSEVDWSADEWWDVIGPLIENELGENAGCEEALGDDEGPVGLGDDEIGSWTREEAEGCSEILGDPSHSVEAYEELFDGGGDRDPDSGMICRDDLLSLYGALFAEDGRFESILSSEEKIWQEWDSRDHSGDEPPAADRGFGPRGTPSRANGGGDCGDARDASAGLDDYLDDLDDQELFEAVLRKLRSLPLAEALEFVEAARRSGSITAQTADRLTAALP